MTRAERLAIGIQAFACEVVGEGEPYFSDEHDCMMKEIVVRYAYDGELEANVVAADEIHIREVEAGESDS